MVALFHPDGAPNGSGSTGAGAPNAPMPGQPNCRLNLLLTYGGWKTESWADSLPRLLEPMGVQARRAACGREAATLLAHTPIHAAVVDLTLPLDNAAAQDHAQRAQPGGVEEAGARLLELLARLPNHPPIIVVREPRSSREAARDLAAALRHGVFAVVDRPVNLEIMLEVLRRLVRRHYYDRWPGMNVGQG